MFGGWPDLATAHCAPLIEAAGRVRPGDVAAVAQLRRSWPPDRVRLAIELAAARRKAAEKFDHPERIVADAAGVEQATSLDVARHKAQRFAGLGADAVLDLCCGIGGDAMALAEAGPVFMFDRDPVRAWMAHHNVAAPAAVADVTMLNVAGRTYHIDPSRRGERGRVWRYEAYEPGPVFLEVLARGDGAMKLSPGVDFKPLPPGEIEVISRHGMLVQAVLWTGRLAQHERTATRVGGLPPHASVQASGRGTSAALSLHGAPDRPIPIDTPRRYLHSIEPAVERAGLIGELCQRTGLAAIHPALGLLTSETLAADPWLTPFELIESMPWRPERVRQWLASHGAGVVEVKTRGGAVDPDTVQRRLRGAGDRPFTVFVLRFGRKLMALVTRRIAGATTAAAVGVRR